MVFIRHLPKGSAVHTAAYPPTADDLWTLEAGILAAVFDAVNVSNYLLQRLAGNDKAVYPDPLPRPGVRAPEGTEAWSGAPVTIEEMNERLNWPQT